jgi:hypothetical protein
MSAYNPHSGRAQVLAISPKADIQSFFIDEVTSV